MNQLLKTIYRRSFYSIGAAISFAIAASSARAIACPETNSARIDYQI
ncbi:MAG: hypothetical protein HC925_02140 [Coleofasciculaceae cyanobacterium SM2_3_26]|nr:hypothetical protein [Coleofasciculaceae cyanobacterium SM2_3_26]